MLVFATFTASSASAVEPAAKTIAVRSGGAVALCAPSKARGTVPASFAIDACLDAGSVWLHNTLDIPIQLATSGALGSPKSVHLDQSIAAVVTRRRHRSDLLLMPGDIMRIPLGSGPARVTLANTDAGGFFALASTAERFFPVGAVYGAITGLITELDGDFAQQEHCLIGKGRIGRLACTTLFVRNVTFAVGRATASGLLRGAKARIASLVVGAASWARWTKAQVTDVSRILHSSRTIVITAATSNATLTDARACGGTDYPPSSSGVLDRGACAHDTGSPIRSSVAGCTVHVAGSGSLTASIFFNGVESTTPRTESAATGDYGIAWDFGSTSLPAGTWRCDFTLTPAGGGPSQTLSKQFQTAGASGPLIGAAICDTAKRIPDGRCSVDQSETTIGSTRSLSCTTVTVGQGGKTLRIDLTSSAEWSGPTPTWHVQVATGFVFAHFWKDWSYPDRAYQPGTYHCLFFLDNTLVADRSVTVSG